MMLLWCYICCWSGGGSHESGMGSEVICSVEKKVLYCSDVVKTEQ